QRCRVIVPGRHAHDPGDAAAVEEELLDGVAAFAACIEAAEHPLEIAEAADPDGFVERTALEEINKGGVGRADAGNGVNAAGNLLDIYARIGIARWHGHLPSVICFRDGPSAAWRAAVRRPRRAASAGRHETIGLAPRPGSSCLTACSVIATGAGPSCGLRHGSRTRG